MVLTRCPCFLPPTPSTRRGTGRSPRREDAIENALKAKLQARAAQRRAQEMMARQAAKELEEFTNEFKNAARHCFELIDVDKGGSLSKEEMSARCVRPSTRARRGDGAAALVVRRVWGGSLYAIDATRRLPPDPPAASTPSTRRLGSMSAKTASYNRVPFNLRGLRGTAVFVCLVCGGAGLDYSDYEHTHTKERPRHTSRRSQKVIKFLKTCGEENLQFLLHPPRLQKALEILDTDKSGEVDADEWRVARRPFHLVSRRSSDVVSRAGRRPSTGASRSASSSSRPSRSGGRGPRPRPTANSPRSSSTRPASASGSSTGTGAGRSRRLRSCAPCALTRK